IDHFKLFNDRHGHDFGDEVLRATADRIKALIREDDKVYRFGGEEFIVVFDEADAEAGRALAERIRAGVSETQLHHDTTDVVTVSVGVCSVPQDCGDFLTAVRLADRAMYYSKRSGRDRVTLWSEIAAMAAA
ncbi:MAG: GGDEF domain-containing protein, partial [Dehalococcoidia bacterium]